METLAQKEGIITQVIGPVIDVEFKYGELPEINDAVEIVLDDGKKVIAEVRAEVNKMMANYPLFAW